jgi:hypothetical protein
VISTVPAPVVIATARACGMECAMWISSIWKGPAWAFSPAGSSSSGTSFSLCSSSLERTMPTVSSPL